MGWSGYGLEDGDGTTSCAQNFLIKAKILNKDAETLVTRQGEHDVFDLQAKDYDLTDEDLAKLYKKYKTVLRTEVPASLLRGANLEAVCARPQHNAYYEETILVPIQMMAQIFLASRAVLPRDLLGLAKEATQALIQSDHTKAFDRPARRRKVLEAFLDTLDQADDAAERYYNPSKQGISYRRGATNKARGPRA